jgi:ABC-type nitrate/sulfonate/bicarbonate transport system permease component
MRQPQCCPASRHCCGSTHSPASRYSIPRPWQDNAPGASHAILAGLRIGLTLAVVLAVQAEPNGLGSGVVAQQPALRPAAMFADVVVIGLPGLALNSLFFFCRRVAQGHRP